MNPKAWGWGGGGGGSVPISHEEGATLEMALGSLMDTVAGRTARLGLGSHSAAGTAYICQAPQVFRAYHGVPGRGCM